MAANDLSVREELIAEGSLGKQGYHPRMEAVHKINAAHLATIIEQHGWPGRSLVGDDGAEAAWLIAQHSIGNPTFMRQCLSLLKQAASHGEVLRWQPAMLEDRIRMFEGKPQIYGSQFQPDESGQVVPYPIDSPGEVEDRRREVGLNSLKEKIAELRGQAAREKAQLPPNWRKEYDEWLRAVGWRK